MSVTAPADVLEAIIAAVRRTVEMRAARLPAAQLERSGEAARPQGAAFRTALARADRLNVIAECKRRSPSKGVLRAIYEPAPIARAYEAAGAAAVSVLTEPTFFDGSLEHLQAVRTAVDLPLLRKDFVVSEYQLLEARAAGADAVLLIVAALDDRQLRALRECAASLGLAALVEVHTRDELARAVDAGADIVGINSRDLRTLDVHQCAARDLVSLVPRGTIAVAESGIHSGADLRELRALGYHAFLIGERLMIGADPGAALRELIAEAEAQPREVPEST